MTCVLLTLGRLPKALDLARGFAEMGCTVLVAEPFRRHLTGFSRAVAASFTVPPPSAGKRAYLAALSEIVHREQVDLVLPVSEETMHVAFLRDLLPPATRLFTMAPEKVLAVYDKENFIALAEQSGLAVPRSARLGSAAAQSLRAGGDVVLKPAYSCSGRGMQILRQDAPLPPPSAQRIIVQQFLSGREYSSCSLARDGRCLSSVIYRGSLMSGTVAVGFERVEQDAIAAWIEHFVAAQGWSGFISFDFIVTDEGVFAIECNPRATSGVHFWNCADIAATILGEQVPIRLRPETRLQQFYSCLTETQKAMRPGGGFAAKLRQLVTTRDVSWQRDDPMPFLTMTYSSWPIISRALAERRTFGEVATQDVGWYEDGV